MYYDNIKLYGYITGISIIATIAINITIITNTTHITTNIAKIDT